MSMWKVCNVCKKEKDETEFSKHRGTCKICRNNESRKAYHENDNVPRKNEAINQHAYYFRHRERILKTRKDYYLKNKYDILLKRKGYYNKNKETVIEKVRNYNEKNKPVVSSRHKQYYIKNRENLSQYYKKYRAENSVKISIYYKSTLDKRREYARGWNKTPYGREYAIMKNGKRRNMLGYNPINSRFNDSNYHHLRYTSDNGEVDNDIGIFIPEKLHKSIKHNGETGKNMSFINEAALEWYINNTDPDKINPTAVCIYKNFKTA